MKKVLVIISSFFLFSFLAGCSLLEPAIDEVAVHNGLVDRLDAVLDAEEVFFQEYLISAGGPEEDVEESVTIEYLAVAYTDFSDSVASLDGYVQNTEFAESQQLFRDEYFDSYSPFINDYLAYSSEFVTAVEEGGLSYEVMEPYFDKLDQYTLDFVDVHNQFIDKVNAQSTEI